MRMLFRHNVTTLVLFLTIFIFHFSFFICTAGMPQPGVVYYGQALNEQGWPYVKDAVVVLKVNAQDVAAYPIRGMLSPGVNFKLYAYLEEDEGETRHADSVHVGDPVDIVVRVDGEEKTIFQDGVIPPVPEAGGVASIRITTGTDTDGDGISDAWKRELIKQSDGKYTTLDEVDMLDDLDGDGFTNLEEYYACTAAYSIDDYFSIEDLEPAENGRLAIRFHSIPGKTYQVQEAFRDENGRESWNSANVASEVDAAVATASFSGAGVYETVYIEARSDVCIYRVLIQ